MDNNISYEDFLKTPISDEEWKLNDKIGTFVYRGRYGGKFKDDKIILHDEPGSWDVPLFTRSLYSLMCLIADCNIHRLLPYSLPYITNYFAHKPEYNPILSICNLIADIADKITPINERISSLEAERGQIENDIVKHYENKRQG